jgi:hypothetical protein
MTAGVRTGPSVREAPAGLAGPLRAGRPGPIAATLALLFPPGPPPPPRSRARAAAVAAGYVLAAVLGAWVLLERQAGHRPWNTIWAEDGGVFYPSALLHPLASLMQPYAGYLQLVPRLIAGAVALLPLRAAAAGLAVAGALVAAACAVFVCHASAGHIRTPALRWLLAAGVILLPTALTELSGNGVNTPWYLLFALFWAILWRPRSVRGAALAAAIGFAAASSNALAALFAPLVLARVIALPRAREQAASVGWAAGGVLQLIAVLRSGGIHHTGHVTAGLDFYLHGVLVTAVAGRHFAVVLGAQAGHVAGAVIPATVAAAVAGWALVTGGPRVRLFVATALALGLALVLAAAVARGWGTPGLDRTSMRGARYAATPILLIYSLTAVAVDAYLRRVRDRGLRLRRGLAVTSLAVLLGAVWAADFSYLSLRSSGPPWSQLVAGFQQRCEQQPSPAAWQPLPPMGWIKVPPLLPCSLVIQGGRLPVRHPQAAAGTRGLAGPGRLRAPG